MTKCPPKKLKLKNEWDIANLENGILILTFFGGGGWRFVWALRQVRLFKISIKFPIFFIPYMTYFKKKNSPLRWAIFKFFRHKHRKKIETPQSKEKCLL